MVTNERLVGLSLALSSPDTPDLIATVAAVLALSGGYLAYRQLKAGQSAARGQFLLDMDQAFDADTEIRRRLARNSEDKLSADEWFKLKRYMGRFERVEIFVQEGLLEERVVHRLYGARFRGIVRNEEVRKRLLYDPVRARSWTYFIALWRRLDRLERADSGDALCASADLPAAQSERDPHLPSPARGEDIHDEA
jgi:hypothetical protein